MVARCHLTLTLTLPLTPTPNPSTNPTPTPNPSPNPNPNQVARRHMRGTARPAQAQGPPGWGGGVGALPRLARPRVG